MVVNEDVAEGIYMLNGLLSGCTYDTKLTASHQ